MLTGLAKLKDRRMRAVLRVNPDTVKAFCSACKSRFADPSRGPGKACLRRLIEEIRLHGNEPVVAGSHRRRLHAIGFKEKRKLGEVPGCVNDWRARRVESGHRWHEVLPADGGADVNRGQAFAGPQKNR